MRDNLDLEQLQQQGLHYRAIARRRRTRTILVIVIVIIITILLQRGLPTSLGSIYTLRGTGWQEVHIPFAGAPYRILTDSRGTIWVSTAHYCGVHRYSSGQWISVDDSDLGIRACGETFLASYQEDVWIALGNSAARYDGTKWTPYPAILPSTASSIAAGKSGVFVIDYYGNIAHFDGQRWITLRAADVLPQFQGGSDATPSLLQMADGSVWLAYYGLWRFDGRQWSQQWPLEPENAKYYRLLTSDDTSIWMTNEYGLARYDVEIENWQQYSMRQMGLHSGVPIYSAAWHQHDLWVATGAGVTVFSDGIWKPLPVQSTFLQEVGGLTFDDNGTLWVTSYTTEIYNRLFIATYSLRVLAIALCSPALMLLAFVFLWGVPALRSSIQRIHQAQTLIREILPDHQSYISLYQNTRRSYWWWVLGFPILLGLVIGLGLSGPSLLVMMLLTAATLSLWTTGPALWQLRKRAISAENRAYLRRHTVQYVVLWTALSLFVFGAAPGMSAINQAINSDLVGTLLIALLGFGIVIALFFGILFLPHVTIYRGPVAHSDYLYALERIKSLRRWLPKYPSFLSLHGLVLLFAGRYTEAEHLWRTFLAEVHNGSVYYQAIALANLGYALNGQGRSAEALPVLSTAIMLLPENPSVYQALTDHYLLQDRHSDRALELSQVMMRFARKPHFNWLLNSYDWGAKLETRALALATSQQFQEARDLLDRAFHDADAHFQPGIASLHLTAGKIKLLEGHRPEAIDQFNQALSLDPEGAIGQRARDAITKLESEDSSHKSGRSLTPDS